MSRIYRVSEYVPFSDFTFSNLSVPAAELIEDTSDGDIHEVERGSNYVLLQFKDTPIRWRIRNYDSSSRYDDSRFLQAGGRAA